MSDSPITDTDPGSRNAELTWDSDGQPHSSVFDDCYFSRANGLEETRYVFLHNNRLAERFAALPAHGEFVVAETGFGTGLNFLACWQLWQQTAPSDARLHFVTVEKYPLRREDLRRALALWPELQSLSDALLDQYPAITNPAFHRLTFDQGRITLTLIIDDACNGFEQLLESDHPAHQRPRRAVDAWFLDGFAPAKNPDMWRDELFQLIHKLSHSGTTAATFTAAGIAKRGLRDNGFLVRKSPGFGHKRDMIVAQLQQPFITPPVTEFPASHRNAPWGAPWYCGAATPKQQQALVIGAGLAGCHTARALAERGWQVTVVERHPQPASEGSGNPQGILYAKLSHRPETLADFNLLALQFAQRHYAPFWATSADSGTACGVLQLAHSDKSAELQQRLQDYFGEQELFRPLTAAEASKRAGVTLDCGGLLFPESGWLSPAAVCRQLLQHDNIHCRYDTAVESLQWQADLQQWQVNTGSDPLYAANVIVTAAQDSRRFDTTRGLPLKPIRGQVSVLRADATTEQLQLALCGDGYIAPARDGRHCLGATYDPRDLELTVREEDHHKNLQLLSTQVPALSGSLLEENVISGRSGLRCTSPDYLPLVGPVADESLLRKEFELLAKNARASIATAGSYLPGLYVNVGHGSRGLAYTPVCAELLAAVMHGEPSPLSRNMRLALHPARFAIRDLIRGK